MPRVEHSDQDKRTLLEVVLRIQGDFRRRLEPIGVTPLQAGVMLYLQRHPDAKMKDTAAALDVKPPTLTAVIDDLVRKRWVTRQRALHDDRAVCLQLSRQGQVVAEKIKTHVRDVQSDLTLLMEA
jgi:DNA-binding MarR family transcriptional regulator